MGVNVQAQSKRNTAKKYLREALQLFVAIHDKTQAARVQHHLGDIADEQGKDTLNKLSNGPFSASKTTFQQSPYAYASWLKRNI